MMNATSTADSAVSIENRLARIEDLLSNLSQGVNQAPTMLSIATDSVDELLQNAAGKGVNIDDRIKSGVQFLDRLSDPQITHAINGLIDAVEQGPGLVSMVADTLDETIGRANSSSVRFEDRVQATARLFEKLSDPKMVERINSLVELSEQAPGLAAMTMDTIDDFMSNHGEEIKSSMAFLKKENLILLKQVGEAMTESQNEPLAKVGGIFSILRMLRDPGRKKAMGFLMNVLKNLGNKL